VDASTAQKVEVRLYDRLFKTADPEKTEDGGDFIDHLNPDSLKVISHALVEASVEQFEVGKAFQLERVGYFCLDPDGQGNDGLLLNRTVAMRDSWAKANK
jgi:glutaminyl-tRNA synthetase